MPKDIFSVQDEITRRIAGTMAVRLSALEAARAAAKPPDNLEAYDLILRARSLYARGTRTALSQARPLFERARARTATSQIERGLPPIPIRSAEVRINVDA